MRALVVAATALALAGCGEQHRSAPPCSLRKGSQVSERTGEHTLVLTVAGCPLRAMPRVELFGAKGRQLAFAYVPVGGRPGTPQRVVLDKYRCDVRATALAQRVQLTLADGRRLSLRLGPQPLLDWCPAEAQSSIVRVYLGGIHRAGTFRDVFRDVYQALGQPSLDGWRCPVWRWRPESGAVDGARVCFAHGRATTVQTAVHG